ncbi:emp24/gp25L/p24 family/GOLD-domain-containing protein [Lipomyces kononenkoae]|uniref:Emp24/gp25L/p24 family/GOLD-domain-containing protein n=1 Tax=Lipomyces kononenkoae TaxID=34357 RepID=A0ACC3T6D6_LIPKO
MRVRMSSRLPVTILLLVVLAAYVVAPVHALKMIVNAQPAGSVTPRCIRNFVSKEQLVVVNVKTNGRKGDGQVLNMSIMDSVGNEYGRPKDVVGESRTAFTAHANAAFDVCFENIQQGSRGHGSLNREVDLDIDIGADARDWNSVGQTEKLKPMELQLRRIEESVDEIVAQMDYLRQREQKMRDTNESTNDRVKYFALGTLFSLMGLGLWQVAYLRQYFKSKHLI